MLSTIRAILNISDNSADSLLLILIDQAKEEVLNYTKNDDCLQYLATAIQQMVVFKYNRLKTEGLNSESYSGVSFNYSTDYPEAIMRQLRPYRKVIFK